MSNKPKHRTTDPERSQGVIRFEIPDEALGPDHPARALWRVLGSLDLSGFLGDARSVEGRAGRPTHSPRMMLTLWTYAISQGVGSAREIARLIESDRAYEWIAGGVAVGHHVLSKFRVGHEEALDALMTDVLAVLMDKQVLSLRLVAQDGMRVRASASAPSFRKHASLLECQEQAALHLKAVLAQADDPELSVAQKAAQLAAARDFQRRVEEAISTVETLREQRGASRPPARASTTDAEARVMKMGDGGFRPGFNVMLAVAGSELGGPRTVVGVRVNNVGSDMGAVTPMLDEIERRVGQLPENLLADANHGRHDGILDAVERGVNPLIAVSKRTREKNHSDPVLASWVETMATSEEAKRLYRARAGLCEWANAAISTTFGLRQLLVRGLRKVGCVALLHGLTLNLTQHRATLLSLA